MKTRADDVQDNLIVLGSQSVVTTPLGAAVVFSCTYSMTVEVASEDYTVTGASVVDTLSGTGSLVAGFAMTLNHGDSATFFLGSEMSVEINWSITRLSTMTFHLNECKVQHGTTLITIVSGGCYAEALAVVPNATKQGFNFKTFKGAGETDSDQMIKCKLNICEVGQCTNPIADSQCPATGDEKYYGYRI